MISSVEKRSLILKIIIILIVAVFISSIVRAIFLYPDSIESSLIYTLVLKETLISIFAPFKL